MAPRNSGQTAGVLGGHAVSFDAVLALSRYLNEPAWLRDARRAAWGQFLAAPPPRYERGIKGWWVTDLTSLRLERMAPFAPAAGRLPAAAARQPADVAGSLVLANSQTQRATLARELAEQGVVLSDLPSAVRELPDLLANYLGRLVLPAEGKFAALTAALWSNGTFLYVPAGVDVQLPLRVAVSVASPQLALSHRTVVVAERGSKVTLVEDLGSVPAAGGSLFASAVELFVGPGSSLTYVSTQAWEHGVSCLRSRCARLERDARLVWVDSYLGGELLRDTTGTRLSGDGASAESLGLFFAGERQHMDITSYTHHESPRTAANLLLNGAVKDAAHAAFAGTIRVERGGHGANSYLGSHTLTLSDEARIDAVPSLEIEANDVRVSHGSTAGKLDAEQLFYLLTRGLSRTQATRMLVRGFFEPVLTRIPLADVRDRVERLVERKVSA